MRVTLAASVLLLAQIGGLASSEVCDENENIIEPDKWYTYDYEIVAEASSVGSTDDVGNSKLDCRVKIARLKPCQYVFQVEQCLLSAGGGPPGRKKFWMKDFELAGLAENDVLVTLSGGEIEEIAVFPDEPEYLQNVRRALISAFVLKKSHLLTEADTVHTDIHGTCPWKMVPGEEPGTAKSSKDMLYCMYPSRPDSKLSPWSIFWNMTFIQYLINSSVNCDYAASEDLSHLKSLRCHERHAIKLESTHDTTTAVQTNIIYLLKLQNSEPMEAPPSWTSRTQYRVPSGIQYVHTRTPDPTQRGYSPTEDLDTAIRFKFSELVLTARSEVGLYTIPLYQDLMELMRSSPDLTPFVESVVGCDFLPPGEKCTTNVKELAMAFLQDALIQCNNYPSLRAFRHLVTGGHVSDDYLKLPFHSWGYIRMDDPRYLEEVFEICKSTESKMCWLVLGRMAKKELDEAPSKGSKHIPLITERIFKHVLTYLKSDCNPENDGFPPTYTESERIDYIITMLKTIGNGEQAAQLAGTSDSILRCAENPNLPDHVRVIAVEALRGFDQRRKESRFHDLHSKVLRLLEDQSLPSPVRIAAYEVLTRSRYDWRERSEVLDKIEREHGWTSLKDYAVSDYLDSLLDGVKQGFRGPGEKRRHRDNDSPAARLWKEWTKRHPVGNDTMRQSSMKDTVERFFDLPFLPKEIRKFGYKLMSEYIFGNRTSFPHVVKDLQLRLFGRTFDFAEVGAFLEGIDRYMGNNWKLHGQNWLRYLKLLFQPENKQFLQHFPAMRERLQEIINGFNSEREMSLPMAYLRMFGSDMTFGSLSDVQGMFQEYSKTLQSLALSMKPGTGHTFNLTRTIRVIEAYHLVPTLMGIPLNWTTSATLVVSFRSGVKGVDRNTYSGFIHPSAALTFLNRMLLDFPTVTKIGVQANSSAHTSTQLDAMLWSDGQRVTVEVLKPQAEQKVLVLRRTNQLIKHDSLQEMTDWDVERVTTSWRSNREFSTSLGLRACIDQSYANVTHRMKPWFLMAAPAYWNLILEPYPDSTVSSYAVSGVLPLRGSREQGLELHGYVQGTEPEDRVTFLRLEDRKFEIVVPGAPFMRLAFIQEALNEADDDDDVDAVTASRFELTFSSSASQVYLLTYTNETRQESREFVRTIRGHHKMRPARAVVHEESWILRSPHNVYTFIFGKDAHPNGLKASLKFMVERGRVTESQWLSDIVPAEFWEDDTRAWVLVQGDWKSPTPSGKGMTSRTSRSYVLTPKTVAELLVHSLGSSTHNSFQVNMTHAERQTGRLLAFANFTHSDRTYAKGHLKQWSSKYNFTVSHHSWEVQLDASEGHHEVHTSAALLWEKMVKRDSSWKFFSTWWHPSTSHLFEAKRQKLELRLTGPGEKLWSRFGEADLNSAATLTFFDGDRDVQLLLVNANLTFLADRQQLQLLLKDAVHNTKLTARGTLALDDDGIPIVSGVSRISGGPENDVLATYRLDYVNPGGVCPSTRLSHSIASTFWQYRSTASAECSPDEPINAEITIRSNSDSWDLLNINLNQTFVVGDNSGCESTNMTYALGQIKVDGHWDEELYEKNAVFLDKVENKPVLKLHLVGSWGDWLLRSRAPGDDGLAAHDKQDSSGAVLRVGLIPQLTRNTLVVLTRPDRLRDFAQSAVQNAEVTSRAIWSALNDEDYPLNKLLQPVIGVPLGKYIEQQSQQVRLMLQEARKTAVDVVQSFESVYDPYVSILNGLAIKAHVASEMADSQFRQTVPGWAFYYFNLDKTLQYTATHVPELSASLLGTYFSQPLDESKLLLWTVYLPRWIDFVKYMKSTAMQLGIIRPPPSLRGTGIPPLQPGQKMAAIFGADHVVTFDGAGTVFPEYPAPYCTYLLAHHKGGHTFTLATNKEDVLVDYPHVAGGAAVTITGSGEVRLNGKKEALVVPFESPSGHVTVSRDGPVVRVEGPGLAVHCDSVKFFCVFVLDPAYQGSVIGILGNADGIPENDFVLPSGDPAADIAALAAAYELGDHPECQALIAPEKDFDKSPQCTHHPVSNECLEATGMQQAMERACAWDLHRGRGECARVNFMVASCWYHGFKEKVRQCGGCIAENSATGTVTMGPEKVLETVVLVDGTSFERDDLALLLRGTKSLLVNIDGIFKGEGYGTRYAFVSNYGRTPSFYASDGDVFVDSLEQFNSLLRVKSAEREQSNVDLDFLLDYTLDHVPFDPKATRVILALTASDFNTTRDKLVDLQRKLESSGATLYSFSTYSTIHRGKKVYGVRADGLIFPPPSHSKETYLNFPSKAGLLAKLVAATKGSIYHKSFVVAGEPTAFFDSVSEEIMAKVGKEVRYCKRCSCAMSSSWNMVSRCTTVNC